MRIAQVAPLYESCPPQLYGGTERVDSYLTEELVGLGHEVTLFASGDSETSATLEPCCERGLSRDRRIKDPVAHHLLMLDRVRQRAHQFDVIHCHTEYLHPPFLAECWNKTVTTMHGRLDLPELQAIFGEFPANAAGLDLDGTACAAGLGALARHGLSWLAANPASAGDRQRRLSGVSRPHQSREGPRPRD